MPSVRGAGVLAGALVVGAMLVSPAVAGATVVTNTADVGAGSLRDAIANATAHSVITFNVTPVNGQVVIRPVTALPTVPAAVAIDGTSEPGGVPVVLDGSNQLAGNGLTFAHPGAQTTGVVDLRGVYLGDFSGDGVDLASGSFGLVISANFIGIKPDGTAAPNGTGIVEGGVFDHIQNNVISGNTGDGVFVPPPGSDDAISGNRIGTSLAGVAGPGNGGAGVHIASGTNNPGFGPTVNGANVISGNHHGILIDGSGTDGVLVNGNLLGTALDGTTVIGNTGSAVFFGVGTFGNQIGGIAPNTIAYTTGESGVNIGSTVNTAIENNGLGDPQNFILSGTTGPGVLPQGDGTDRFTLTGAPPNTSVLFDFYTVAGNTITFGHSGSATTDATGGVSTVEPASAPCATATPPGGPTSGLGCPAPTTVTAPDTPPEPIQDWSVAETAVGVSAHGEPTNSPIAGLSVEVTIFIHNYGPGPTPEHGTLNVDDGLPMNVDGCQNLGTLGGTFEGVFAQTGSIYPSWMFTPQAAGTTIRMAIRCDLHASGAFINTVTVGQGGASDPNPANNKASLPFTVLGLGDYAYAQPQRATPSEISGSSVIHIASGPVAGDTSIVPRVAASRLDVSAGRVAAKPAATTPAKPDRVAHVQVAVLRVPARRSRTCQWLAASSGRFRAIKAKPAGKCTAPVWVAAKGTTKWTLRIRHALEAGHYRILGRTTTASGITPSTFSTAAHDQRTFTVH